MSHTPCGKGTQNQCCGLCHAEDDEDDLWYDADGNVDEHGCYDAGGHYDGERGACAAEDALDRINDR